MEVSILAIFAAGLLTCASPCVLPLLPVYLAALAGGSLDRARPGRTFSVACAFVLGLMLVFVALGALASSFGALLTAHRTGITLASGVLMVLFGVHALGIVRVRRFEQDARPGLTKVRSVSTLAGAFLFGAAFALGWSPCIGPVLASVLSYAAAHAATPWRGAGYLAVYASGLALPLLVLAALAERATLWVKRMRRVIPVLEKVTGVLLLGVGAWSVIDAWPAATHDPRVALVAPAADSGDRSCTGEGHTCALPEIRAAGEPLPPTAAGSQLYEFGARDCPVCQRTRPVLEQLAAACSELAPRIVHVDVGTASGRALADRYQVRGTPTLVLLNEHGVEEARILGEHTSAALAEAVERAFGVSCWS
ncbi:MAG: cytochrome c biogenesis protein CcdA [Polyangiales bacterium]